MRFSSFIFILVPVMLAVTSCSTPPAPVEERSTSAVSSRNVSQLTNGLYRVNRGESLYSIAFKYGIDWKDIARWNDIRSPYTIYPGQQLKLTAPPAPRRTASPRIATRAAGKTPTATTRSADPEPSTASPPKTATPQPSTTPAPPPRQTPPAAAEPRQTTRQVQTESPPAGVLSDPSSWLWPTNGRVTSTFNSGDPSRKGIDIAGREGQDIVASAAGDVVYSGNGLIGFGELIIVKHSDRMLTAYAHNRQRLVQEGQRVAAGQKIAEMGRNDQEEVMLHFELRVVGKPVDPLQYLPSR